MARRFYLSALSALVSLTVVPALSASNEWSAMLTREPRGNFPELRPGRATFAFGWSGITAGLADVRFSRAETGMVSLEGKGRTIGLARALWRFDVDYKSVAHGDSLRPSQVRQNENIRGKGRLTELAFAESGVVRTRIENDRAPSAKTIPGEEWHDLFSALLHLRSQPLRNGDVYRLAIYPATAGYLATITVLGRDEIAVRAGHYAAIKMDLKVKRIGKKGALEPYKKLKRATVWVSDDSDRILLRVEGQILVGAVTAELQSLKFD